MSELIGTANRHRNSQGLFSTVSALALLAATYGIVAEAAENDVDRPTVWVELGGQLERVKGQGDTFAPAFLSAYTDSAVLQPTTPVQAQKPSQFAYGEEGKISLQPADSNWVFSASIKYGRSAGTKRIDHQTNRLFTIGSLNGSAYKTDLEKFAKTEAVHREAHSVIDFSAGKDVGLGLFGREGSSVISFGVRFAQFTSKATFDVRARPDLRYNILSLPSYGLKFPSNYFHTYHATGSASRSFRGIGPSLSWAGSAPVAGDLQDGDLTFDWGANAGILFGRQKSRALHQESGHYATERPGRFNGPYVLVYQHPIQGHDDDRSVIVPNVGGFVGASYRIEDFKVSAGYRADFFFGAVDGGIDVRNSQSLGFYGPFATVSVGLGG